MSILDEAKRQAKFAQFERLRKSELIRSMPFWLPPTLLIGVFVYGGITWSFVLSLTDFSGLALPEYQISQFDFEMYSRMISDATFWNATRNTVVLLIVFTAACLFVGVLLAILLDQQLRFGKGFRTIYLLPFSLSFVVTGVIWTWMFNYNTGVINSLLRAARLDFLTQYWLSNPSLVLVSVTIALVWQYSGYAMVIYLATLRTIPQEHYEAAEIDGASLITTYRKIIVPQLSSASVSIAVVVMVFALKAFSWLYTVFGDNPGPGADILGTMMYREAFSANQWAYGAALGTILFVLTITVLSPYLYWQYQRGEL
ncbi:carbohydrate ABC transporter permease [Halococcus agarilyticus]|uniref:carbohydrate ABC transporter permease n=1 Tax=Halococcus agarilyticus TaxID=1232219 RepID=UPI0009ABDED7|nr:sugar ABC transporter permease [Halococcus agarilyticus]